MWVAEEAVRGAVVISVLRAAVGVSVLSVRVESPRDSAVEAVKLLQPVPVLSAVVAGYMLVVVGAGADSAVVEWVTRTVGAGDVLSDCVVAVELPDVAEEMAEVSGELEAGGLGVLPAPERLVTVLGVTVRAVLASCVVSVPCKVGEGELIRVRVAQEPEAVRVELPSAVAVGGTVLPTEEA